MRLIDFNSIFQPELLDKDFADAYLLAAHEEAIDAKNPQIVLTAHRNILEAHKSAWAEQTPKTDVEGENQTGADSQ